MTTIFHRLRKYAADVPDSPAILSAGFSHLTYAQLNEQIESTVSALYEFGVSKGDRIAVVLPEGASNAVACLAVMSAATCAPLYRGYSKSDCEGL